jgi:hypothetical protein
LAAAHNIAATDQVPILVRQENGSRSLVPMVWGIPRDRNGSDGPAD